jgi:hypothetical protein
LAAQTIDRRLLKRICWLIFIWACIVRIALFYFADRPSIAGLKVGEMYNVARTIEERGTFSDPYREKLLTGPTAHCGPVFAYFLAAQIRLSPSETFFRYMNSALAALVISVLWGCLPWVSSELGFGPWAGIAGGLYGASNPLYHWLDFEGSWDQNYTALSLALLLVFCVKRVKANGAMRDAAVAGGLWGLLLLMQPSTAMALCALIGAGLLFEKEDSRSLLKRFLVVTLVAGCVVTPWTIRNRIALGGWVPFVRDSFPLELALSFNDQAQARLMDNLFRPGTRPRHPHLNIQEASLVASMGEYRYMKMRQADAIAWIRAHPKRTLELIADHFFIFWVPYRLRWIRIVEAALTCSAFLGLYLARKHKPGAALIGFLWLFFPAVYYLVQADERYRYPINWSILMMAGYCWIWVLRKFARERRDSA